VYGGEIKQNKSSEIKQKRNEGRGGCLKATPIPGNRCDLGVSFFAIGTLAVAVFVFFRDITYR